MHSSHDFFKTMTSDILLMILNAQVYVLNSNQNPVSFLWQTETSEKGAGGRMYVTDNNRL